MPFKAAQTALSRRTFLRGAGITLSLPWLEAMSPLARSATTAGELANGEAPKRAVFAMWGLGVNGAFHMVRDDIEEPGVRPGVHAEWLASASLSYEWTETFGTYYEIAGRFGTQDPRGDIGVLGTGFTYKLAKNVQFDGGINFGITKAADRINQFVGLTVRF